MKHADKYLELWQLQKSYPTPNGSPTVIVSDFTLNVAEGEFISRPASTMPPPVGGFSPAIIDNTVDLPQPE